MLAAPFKYPDKYSINLMWINRTLNKSKPYICGYQSEEELLEKFLDKAKKWKEANPESDIIIWYDSQFTTPEQLAATQAVLDKKAKENPFYNIKLRDIRDIDVVRNNPDAFSDNIPVYFRVDLLKFIICVNSIETDSNEAAIFTDLEVGDYRPAKDRMSKKDLFNPEVMKNLETIGIQLNDSENQFVQVVNKPATLNAMKVYINACLSRAIGALNRNDRNRDNRLTDLSTAVFAMMDSQLFPLIEMSAYDAEGLVNIAFLKTGAGEEWVKYKFEEHGHLPLGNFYLRKYKEAFFIDASDNLIHFKTVLKFKFPSSISDDYGVYFGRHVEVRPGNDHVEDISNLVKRAPADGSQVYQFRPWEIDKKARLARSQMTSKTAIIVQLHLAAKSGDLKKVQALLATNSDRDFINAQNENGDTALHLAAKAGHTKIVQALLENKGDITIRNKKEKTPLEVAATESEHPNREIVTMLAAVRRPQIEQRLQEIEKLKEQRLAEIKQKRAENLERRQAGKTPKPKKP